MAQPRERSGSTDSAARLVASSSRSGSTASTTSIPPSALAGTGNAPKRNVHVSYGATTEVPVVQIASPVGEDEEDMDTRTLTNGYFADDDEDDDCIDVIVDEALLNVSWVWMSRLYLLVPVLTALFFAAMVALIVWGWPPSKEERDTGQQYPHPFFWKAFLVGLFASFTVQTLRVPVFVVTSWVGLSTQATVIASTVLYAAGHEAIRLISVPLTIPSPTSGFHSSYWLGLGWGLAETAWGIVQGWEQLALYEDVVKPHDAWDAGESGLVTVPEDVELLRGEIDDDDEEDDVAELELRVQVLERMRARHELEEVLGLPFPLIPFALHILWRIDALLLNLGLTLILSAFWFDPEPIYKHDKTMRQGDWPPTAPNAQPSPYLPLAWTLVALLHIAVALVWKFVGRAGVGAVTWGGLIVALGTVFSGLGAWGGLV